MAGYQPSGMFYHNGSDWNYLKYLEKKSHFDRLQISVSSDIRRLVASNSDLSAQNIRSISDVGDSIVSSIDNLGSKIDDGFDLLAMEISDVRISVDRLSTICETGFSEISLRLSRLNESIEELIEIAKTPDQTWAFEQFEISRNAFERRLYMDSLDYINRAISGYGDRGGFKLEHRFYILRGLIKLGNEKNFDPAIVDPADAKTDFLLGARYAEHVDNEGMAKANQLAGWAAYCAGEIANSEIYLRKSMELRSDDAHTKFLLAKNLMNQNRVEEARPLFVQAMVSDYNYAIRAGADEDFLDHKNIVESWINYYRNDLIKQCSTFIENVDTDQFKLKWDILLKYDISSNKFIFQELRNKTSNILELPLSSLLVLRDDILEKSEQIVSSISSAMYVLKDRCTSLENASLDKSSSDGKAEEWVITPIAIAVIFLVSLGTFNYAGQNIDEKYGLAKWYLSIIAGALAFFPAFGISTWFVGVCNSMAFSAKQSNFKSGNCAERNRILHDVKLLAE